MLAPRPSAGFFTLTAAVQHNTPTQGASGGRVSNWVTQSGYSAVVCSVQPASGGVFFQFGDRQLQVDTEVYFREPVPLAANGETRFACSNGVKYLVLAAGDEAEQGRVTWAKCLRQW